MLDKNTLDSVYRDIADGGYLDDWVLNCARAMRDQATAAIDFAAENERLKARLDAVREIVLMASMPYGGPHADFLAIEEIYNLIVEDKEET